MGPMSCVFVCPAARRYRRAVLRVHEPDQVRSRRHQGACLVLPAGRMHEGFELCGVCLPLFVTPSRRRSLVADLLQWGAKCPVRNVVVTAVTGGREIRVINLGINQTFCSFEVEGSRPGSG